MTPINYIGRPGFHPSYGTCTAHYTVHLSAELVAAMGGRESVQTQQYVNTQFKLWGVFFPGTVHLWQYVDGSVRYTYRQEQ